MSNSKEFLERKMFEEGLIYFGQNNKKKSIELSDRWHNDKDSIDTLRWNEIENFNDHKGKILDLACGVGTFLFSGLHKKYDVYGIEPEEYKLKYMDMKIDEMNYPVEWKKRIINGVGENLPFENETFDYITSCQTLEHVQDIEKCLDEMIRVLKVGGKIKINCPDYSGFYEPHYRLPFLPKMNKKLASVYLKLLGKPTLGLDTLNWTTGNLILEILEKYKDIEVIDLSELYKKRRVDYIKGRYKLPAFISKVLVNIVYYRGVYFMRQDKQVNMVIMK